jgi:hypothetical protein
MVSTIDYALEQALGQTRYHPTLKCNGSLDGISTIQTTHMAVH